MQTELRISTEGTSNWGQRKNMYQAIGFKTRNPDNTKETPEQQEKAAKRDNLVTKLDDTPTKATQLPANSQAGDLATR